MRVRGKMPRDRDRDRDGSSTYVPVLGGSLSVEESAPAWGRPESGRTNSRRDSLAGNRDG